LRVTSPLGAGFKFQRSAKRISKLQQNRIFALFLGRETAERRRVEKMNKRIWLAVALSVVAIIAASSFAATVQAAVDDWWPMFRHDPSHAGTSTSKGPTTNGTLWTYTTGASVHSSPAIVDGFVYVGSYDRKVYCMNATTGVLRWSYTAYEAVHSSPAVVDGRVYVASGEYTTNGHVYCLNASTGTLIWTIYLTGLDGRFAGVYSSPAVVGGFVYFGCNNGVVYRLNATTGSGVWGVRFSGSGYIVSSPAVADGRVYVGASDGWIFCKNAANGSDVWSFQTGGGVYSSPAIVGGRLYVGSVDRKVYCLNATTGVHIWNYTTGNYVDSSPAVTSDLVYVGSWDGKVYCLNATTGAFVWSYTTGAVVQSSSPAIAGDLAYIGSNDTKVYCLNATSGSPVWSYATGGFVNSPAVANGVVYSGSADGHVYAFGPYVAVSISPSSVVIDIVQSQLFTSNVTHGTTPYSYQWFLNDVPVQGGTSSAWTFTPSSSGSYTVYVNVTDSVGASSKSNSATVTVNPALSVGISPASVAVDVDQSRQFAASVSGGTPPYSYQWYLSGVSVSGATGSSWTFTSNSSGSYDVYVNVTDSVDFRAKSNIASITVNPSPSVTIAPASVAMDVNQSQQFTSAISGGTSPYSYQWYLNGTLISGANSDSWTFAPTSSGSCTVYLYVTDSVGVNAISPAANITVNPAILEFQPLFFLSLFVIATLLSAILLTRKKHLRANRDFRLTPNSETLPA